MSWFLQADDDDDDNDYNPSNKRIETDDYKDILIWVLYSVWVLCVTILQKSHIVPWEKTVQRREELTKKITAAGCAHITKISHCLWPFVKLRNFSVDFSDWSESDEQTNERTYLCCCHLFVYFFLHLLFIHLSDNDALLPTQHDSNI